MFGHVPGQDGRVQVVAQAPDPVNPVVPAMGGQFMAIGGKLPEPVEVVCCPLSAGDDKEGHWRQGAGPGPLEDSLDGRHGFRHDIMEGKDGPKAGHGVFRPDRDCRC